MQGTLHPGFLPTLLGELFIERKSGVLRLSKGVQEKSVPVRRGRIPGVRTRPRAERPRALSGPLDKRLGKVLLELGIRKQSLEVPGGRQALIEALSWEEGTYAFEEQPARPALLGGAVGEETPPETIPEAVRDGENRDGAFDALGDLDRALTLAGGASFGLNLTPADRLVLARVNGVLTIRQLIAATPVPPEEAQQSLLRLLADGVVECILPPPEVQPAAEAPAEAQPLEEIPLPNDLLADPEPVAAPGVEPLLATDPIPAMDDPASEARRLEILAALHLLQGNHFDVLGVPRGASEAEIRAAYFNLVRQFHPDRQTDPALADLKRDVEGLFIRIGEAYEVLGNSKRRARYEAELTSPPPVESAASRELENALLADDTIRKAEQLIADSQYWDAILILEAAIPRIQSAGLKHEAQVWLARAYAKNPKWVRRGEELLQTVVREDPSWVDAYYVLGTIYRGNGLKNRATSMFRKVLELKPSHKPAAAEIRALETDPSTTKPTRKR